MNRVGAAGRQVGDLENEVREFPSDLVNKNDRVHRSGGQRSSGTVRDSFHSKG